MEGIIGFMVRFRFVPKEIELIELSYNTTNTPKNYILEGSEVIIKDNDLENLDIMFNCILDTFLAIGLLPDDEPNELGFELENLNQKINAEYVRLNV